MRPPTGLAAAGFFPRRGRTFCAMPGVYNFRPAGGITSRVLAAPAPSTDHETVANHAGKEAAPMSEDTMDPRAMTERWKGTLGEHLGIEFEETSKDRVVARLAIRDELRTVGGALHGGTLMAFADTMGAVATVLNLP